MKLSPTSHDRVLSSADADWAYFKVLVTNVDGTTTLKTLAELGITSINLSPNPTTTTLADGSQIQGTTTFTRADGTTGRRARLRRSRSPPTPMATPYSRQPPSTPMARPRSLTAPSMPTAALPSRPY